MIAQLFKRRICSENVIRQAAQVAVMLTALLIFVVGFLKVMAMELTEPQMLLGIGLVFSLVLQCATLGVLMEMKRKAP